LVRRRSGGGLGRRCGAARRGARALALSLACPLPREEARCPFSLSRALGDDH
jgi:hypothetical protein